jgi:hypothetical protein
MAHYIKVDTVIEYLAQALGTKVGVIDPPLKAIGKTTKRPYHHVSFFTDKDEYLLKYVVVVKRGFNWYVVIESFIDKAEYYEDPEHVEKGISFVKDPVVRHALVEIGALLLKHTPTTKISEAVKNLTEHLSNTKPEAKTDAAAELNKLLPD